MDKFTELVGSEITARFLKPTQETQEVLQRVVHLLDEVQTIDIPYNHCHLNGVEFGWKVRGIRDQVIALLGKSKQLYVTQWVGLTDEEVQFCALKHRQLVNAYYDAAKDTNVITAAFEATVFYKEIEAALRSKNT